MPTFSSSAPRFTLLMQTPPLFYRLGKFGPFGFVVEGEKKILYFILLFVGKHLKEIEGLNDKRVCIQPAVLKNCMEE